MLLLANYKDTEMLINGDSITISKAELKKWRDHYNNVVLEKGRNKIGWFYLGKSTVIIDILKHIDPLIK